MMRLKQCRAPFWSVPPALEFRQAGRCVAHGGAEARIHAAFAWRAWEQCIIVLRTANVGRSAPSGCHRSGLSSGSLAADDGHQQLVPRMTVVRVLSCTGGAHSPTASRHRSVLGIADLGSAGLAPPRRTGDGIPGVLACVKHTPTGALPPPGPGHAITHHPAMFCPTTTTRHPAPGRERGPAKPWRRSFGAMPTPSIRP